MTISKFNIAILFVFMFSAFCANANCTMSSMDTSDVDIMFTSSKTARVATGAFGEMVGVNTRGEKSAPDFIHKPTDLAADFTGYKIELMTVFNSKLSLNDELFKTFGGISIDQRTANSYAYLIGEFSSEEAADKYFAQMIQARYPDAKVIRYKKGAIVK